MRDNFWITKNTVKEYFFTKGKNMKAIFLMENFMDKALFIMEMEMYIKVNSEIIRKMGKDSYFW